jgi:hypothetical protein
LRISLAGFARFAAGERVGLLFCLGDGVFVEELGEGVGFSKACLTEVSTPGWRTAEDYFFFIRPSRYVTNAGSNSVLVRCHSPTKFSRPSQDFT